MSQQIRSTCEVLVFLPLRQFEDVPRVITRERPWIFLGEIERIG